MPTVSIINIKAICQEYDQD